MKRVTAAVAAGLALWTLVVSAQTFPPASSWTPATRHDVEIRDSNLDVAGTGGRNIVGGADGAGVNRPSVLISSDAMFLYFRLRLADQPTSSNSTWGCEVDADNDTTNSYEYFVGFFHAANAVQLWHNTTPSTPPTDEAESFQSSYAGSTYSNAVQATDTPLTNYWESWAVPRAGVGIYLATPFRVICGVTSDGKAHLTTGTAADIAGDGGFSDPMICDDTGCTRYVTGVDPTPELRALELATPWPNPARGSFNLRFGLVHESRVRLTVHDLQGRCVATVIDAVLSPGVKTAMWESRFDNGARAPAGVYNVRLQAGARVVHQRCVVLR